MRRRRERSIRDQDARAARPDAGGRPGGGRARCDVVAAAVEPGISTAELDAIAEREIRGAGAVPSFQGYHGYPATICTSVNDAGRARHPQPDRTRLAAGDLISVDCGAIVGGWHGDAARHGRRRPDQRRAWPGLLEACERALWPAWPRAGRARRLTDISAAVEADRAAPPARTGSSRTTSGHGIGTQMHMDPPVPNYGRPGRGPVLTEGMALAIEPMLVLGDPETRRAGRRLDRGHRGRHLGGALRAHGGHHGGRPLGADRRGRRGQRPGGGPRRPSGAPAAGRPGPRACPRRGRRDGSWEDRDGASDPRIRASDDDRDRTATLLREHHAVGRLTAEEFNERLDKTFAAKTVGELDELLADLPAIDLYRLPDQACPAAAPAHARATPRRWPRRPSAGAPAMRQHGRFSPAWQAAWGSLVQRVGRAHRDLGAERDGLPVVRLDRRPVGRGPARPLDHRQPPRRRRATGSPPRQLPGTGRRTRTPAPRSQARRREYAAPASVIVSHVRTRTAAGFAGGGVRVDSAAAREAALVRSDLESAVRRRPSELGSPGSGGCARREPVAGQASG